MNRLHVNVALACAAMALGTMLSGCAVMTAMGESPEAVNAVQGISNQDWLRQVAMRGQREDARIAAIKKLDQVNTLEELVCSGKENKDIRLAAFDRLVALDKVEQLLEDDDFAETIAFRQPVCGTSGKAQGGTSGEKVYTDSAQDEDDETVNELLGKSVSRTRSTRSTQVQSAPQTPAGETFAFPDEWRKKASIDVYRYAGTGHERTVLNDIGKKILLDPAESTALRIALIESAEVELSNEQVKTLAEEILSDNRKLPILNRLFAKESPQENAKNQGGKAKKKMQKKSQNLHKQAILEACYGKLDISLEGRKLLFSFLDDEDIKNGLLNAMYAATKDEEDGKTDSENIQFAKWAIANTGSPKALGDYVRGSGSSDKYAPWLIEAVKHIDDDAELEKILKRDFFELSFPTVAVAVSQQFKSPEMKAKYGAPVLAKCSPDAATRAKALVDVLAKDRKAAYEVVDNWFLHEDEEGMLKGTDILYCVTDMKVLAGLLAEAQKDKRKFKLSSPIPGIKQAIFKLQKSKFDALPADKLEALAASVKARAEKLNGEGKTLVVGNYWIGMPLMGFFALEKSQEIKSIAGDWDFDSEGKNVIVTKLIFNPKNVYAATGVEKSDSAEFEIARKLELSQFKVGVTKIQRNTSEMNQIAEFFGDYSNSWTGGDVYYESVNHRTGVLVRYWNDTGTMEIEVLKD